MSLAYRYVFQTTSVFVICNTSRRSCPSIFLFLNLILLEVLLHTQDERDTSVSGQGFAIPPGMHSRASISYTLVSHSLLHFNVAVFY